MLGLHPETLQFTGLPQPSSFGLGRDRRGRRVRPLPGRDFGHRAGMERLAALPLWAVEKDRPDPPPPWSSVLSASETAGAGVATVALRTLVSVTQEAVN